MVLENAYKKNLVQLYIIDLKGAIRGKSGDRVRKEGQNVFDIMTGVAITILVKNPNSTKNGDIYFYNIGDYLKRTEKIGKLQHLKSINGISALDSWIKIIPDQFNDWINQRDPNFDTYLSMGDKKR